MYPVVPPIPDEPVSAREVQGAQMVPDATDVSEISDMFVFRLFCIS